jgi:hypothetical protein
MSTRTRSRQEEKRVRILYYSGVIDEAAMNVHSVSSYHAATARQVSGTASSR